MRPQEEQGHGAGTGVGPDDRPHVVDENDWAHSWQKYYKPMPVGERLYIVPEWEREAFS